MRAFLMTVFLLGSLGSLFAAESATGTNDIKAVPAATGRILKLLPFLLDKNGRIIAKNLRGKQ